MKLTFLSEGNGLMLKREHSNNGTLGAPGLPL